MPAKKSPEMVPMPRMSIFRWVPDPDELRELLMGAVKPRSDDVMRIGDSRNGGSQDRN